MVTLTGKFFQELIKKNGNPIVDDKILLEAKMIITDEMCNILDILNNSSKEGFEKKKQYEIFSKRHLLKGIRIKPIIKERKLRLYKINKLYKKFISCIL